MTREEFIKVLDEKRYPYEIQGNKIVVLERGYVYLTSLTSLPPGVEFRNGGYVDLNSLTSLPPGVEFRNGGSVDLDSLTSIPPSVEFGNQLDVFLGSLIRRWDGSFYSWGGNIRGIDSKKLLNKMIKDGLFER